jgi:hypothetical protein
MGQAEMRAKSVRVAPKHLAALEAGGKIRVQLFFFEFRFSHSRAAFGE